MNGADPVAAIERWLAAGGELRTRQVRGGIAVDLVTCDRLDVVETITVPADAHDATLAALLTAADKPD
ncbi:hypothetical protein [Ruania alba]|uniref:Uncharacterized protein n=1 Tax=Ruania alba TaxID=648782 RepID=A0A1H5EVA9_9MICO|nr:hypothetical protein [Ruania alba]SED95056.1 hypothetical protein SAMN04488554_1141 [Ruania alba]